MIEINETPLRTSRNYGINNFLIDENIVSQKIGEFKNFKTSDDGLVFGGIEKIKVDDQLSPVLADQLKNSSNINKKIEILKSKKEPFIFKFDFDKLNPALVENLSVEIKDKISTNIIFKFSSNVKAYHNGNISIKISEGAVANIVLFSDLGNESDCFLNVNCNLEKNAKLVLNFVNFNSKTSIFRVFSNSTGKNSKIKINSIYVGMQNSRLDLNYCLRLLAPNCKAEVENVGALGGNACKNFKGTIDFVKGAKNSFGSENEFCMLLSKSAKSKSLPMLLCSEEAVDGKHSSSAGKIDDKILFYLMSRGLTKSEAIKLAVKAKFKDALDAIFDENLKVEILDKIDRCLNNEKF